MRRVPEDRLAEITKYVREHWRYDRNTGLIHGRLNKPIGYLRKDGALHALAYLPTGVASVLLHRAAWLLATGAWPSKDLDHRNGNRADNRWANLREATRSENRQNLKARGRRGNLRGCSRYYRKWKAQIRVDGVVHYLGLFNTEAEAHAAYCAAKERLHPFNPQQRAP